MVSDGTGILGEPNESFLSQQSFDGGIELAERIGHEPVGLPGLRFDAGFGRQQLNPLPRQPVGIAFAGRAIQHVSVVNHVVGHQDTGIGHFPNLVPTHET